MSGGDSESQMPIAAIGTACMVTGRSQWIPAAAYQGPAAD
jgi:hypothetical protein